jgi:hypothetical protein
VVDLVTLFLVVVDPDLVEDRRELVLLAACFFAVDRGAAFFADAFFVAFVPPAAFFVELRAADLAVAFFVAFFVVFFVAFFAVFFAAFLAGAFFAAFLAGAFFAAFFVDFFAAFFFAATSSPLLVGSSFPSPEVSSTDDSVSEDVGVERRAPA